MLGFVSLICALTAVRPSQASYAYYVGRDLTADGSVLVGGTGEEVSSHWMVVVPRRQHPPGATQRVGVTAEADMPGELIDIPQVRTTFKYLAMRYTEFKGLPPPLVNGGLNEHGVAVRDVWAPSRKELVAMTPRPQRGPNYSDLARLSLERATTAREAVEVIGGLIDAHGYSSYGGNSWLVADATEGWVILAYAGGKGLWVAERLEPDEARVLYPGYIETVPKDYARHRGFMGSKNLISFAVEQGWYGSHADEPFDVHAVYGPQGVPAREGRGKYLSAKTLERELAAAAPLTVAKMMAFVRDPRIADEEAGYGQVAHLRRGVHPELGVLWVAPTGSVTSPFVPYWMGVTGVIPEYGAHRYLTKDAGRYFLEPDSQAREATLFAGRLFKRLLYYTCAHPEKFLGEVTEALRAFEGRALADQPLTERTAKALFDAGKAGLARRYLTEQSAHHATEALALGRDLLGSIERRTKLIYGVPGLERSATSASAMNAAHGDPTPNCLIGADPDRPAP